MADQNGLTQKQLNKFMQDKGDWFKVEPAKDNMKGKGEDPKPFGEGDHEKDIQKALNIFKQNNHGSWSQ